MAFLIIPTTPGSPFQSQRVRLEGRDYNLNLAWNQRESAWYLSLYDSSLNPLVLGKKLIFRASYLLDLFDSHHSEEGVPPGIMFISDLTGSTATPGLDELGPDRRVQLIYRESTT